MSLDLALAVISPLVAALAALIAGIQAGMSQRRLRDDISRLQSLRPDAVLDNAELVAAGDLLVLQLGATSVRNYAADQNVQSQFRDVLGTIQRYLGDEVDERDSAPSDSARTQTESPTARRFDARTSVGVKAFEEAESGQVWNALAGARRALELILRTRLDLLSRDERPIGAGQLIQLAARRGVIESTRVRSLQKAIAIANHAIHGREVEFGAALEAIATIDDALFRLEAE